MNSNLDRGRLVVILIVAVAGALGGYMMWDQYGRQNQNSGGSNLGFGNSNNYMGFGGA